VYAVIAVTVNVVAFNQLSVPVRVVSRTRLVLVSRVALTTELRLPPCNK